MEMADQLPTPTDFPAPENGQPDLLIIAGEHSGDEHVAQLLTEISVTQPNLQVACLGGVELKAAGAQLLYDLTAVSIVGFVEVVRHYRFFKKLFDQTIDWIERYKPKHICLVDYPGFNLRLAEQLRIRGLSKKGGGSIGISYYIGPQVWAWKAKRRFKMAETLDRLGVIFPFEVDGFKDTDLPVKFVGHPFVREDFQLPFIYESNAPVLLLPGSRSAAVSRIFPVLLDGFRVALKRHPDLKATVVYPSEPILALLKRILDGYGDLVSSVTFISNNQRNLPASAVLMSSGTMSLSVALSGIPGAIAYRLNPVSYWLGRVLVNIPYIGISNLLLNEPLHPEYIQSAATAQKLGEVIIKTRDADASLMSKAGATKLRQILDPGTKADSAGEWLLKGMTDAGI